MTPQSRRHELTYEQWEKLEPLLPPQKPHTGRPSKDHRTVINGILNQNGIETPDMDGWAYNDVMDK